MPKAGDGFGPSRAESQTSMTFLQVNMWSLVVSSASSPVVLKKLEWDDFIWRTEEDGIAKNTPWLAHSWDFPAPSSCQLLRPGSVSGACTHPIPAMSIHWPRRELNQLTI
jgi:hypothetical protein